MRILVVEDNVVAAHFLRKTLERFGHRVEIATNGVEAWTLLQDHSYDIVISDWVMPEMDGPELCRRVRARDGYAYTYVILLSAKDQREDRLEGLQSGADDFLVKPLDNDELAARLEVARRILAMQAKLAQTIDSLEIANARIRDASTLLEQQKLELERVNAKLEDLATSDGLTGLKNHRAFQERLADEIQRGARHYAPLSLMMLDVDHFKQYNDQFGHPTGDQVLKQVAAILQANSRVTDFVARYGGEEFVILLPHTGRTIAADVAERIRASVADHPWELRQITVSIGVTSIDTMVISSMEIVEAADRALYMSKSSGRNRVTYTCVAE